MPKKMSYSWLNLQNIFHFLHTLFTEDFNVVTDNNSMPKNTASITILTAENKRKNPLFSAHFEQELDILRRSLAQETMNALKNLQKK